jgi:hypothetical protein
MHMVLVVLASIILSIIALPLLALAAVLWVNLNIALYEDISRWWRHRGE